MPTDSLFEACRQIGAFYGVEVRKSNRCQDKVETLLEGSGLLYRQVILDEAWWQTDSGTLLALTKETGSAVALFPTAGSRYRYRDSVTGKSRRVTREFAHQLKPLAWSLSKALPSASLGVSDLVRECAAAIPAADLVRLLVLGLAGGLLGMGVPAATAWLLSETIQHGLVSQFVALAVVLASMTVAGVLFQQVRIRSALRITIALSRRLEPALWDRLLRLPASFFRSYSSGELLHRVESLSRIRQLASEVAVQSLLTGVFSLLNLVLLFVWCAPLAVVATVLAALGTLLALRWAWRGLGPAREIQKLDARILGNLAQIVLGIAKIRLTNTSAGATRLWAVDFAAKQEQQEQSARLDLVATAFHAAWPVFCLALFYGLYSLGGGFGLSFGTFLGFVAAFQLLLSSLQYLTNSVADLVVAVPLFEHGQPLLQADPEVRPDRCDPGDLSGRIELQGVTFSYPGRDTPVLSELNLRIEPGEYLAVTGTSGSGKSTLLRLLLGFEQPQAGAVLYNGLDLKTLDPAAFRRQVGVVLQDCRVMAGTVLANIAGASISCSPEDAMVAAALAGLDQDIRALPMGLYTVLAEGGSTLSGGQRQRLLIARALVDRPKVVLFDEATSALDNRTQDRVTQSLRDMNATRVVIAHRLSTVAEADRIAVLQAGRVVEIGSYQQLLATGGPFSELVRRQMVY